MILEIIIFYLVFTRGMVFGYFIKDKKEYIFNKTDYIEYVLNFLILEIMLVLNFVFRKLIKNKK